MGATISGLSSGLDTATIINQLMQIEAQPQDQLKSRVGVEQKTLAAFQALNTKFANLTTAAAALAKTSAWSPLTATSSNTAITATATSSASATTLSLTVTSLARTTQQAFADAHALTDDVSGLAGGGSSLVSLTKPDGSTVSVDSGDGTLQGLVNALNDPANATGLHANAVQVAPGSYRLVVESAKTGAATGFTLTRADGSALLGGATTRAGSDAAIDLGGGVTATSTTNTFSGLVPGVDVTLGATATIGSTTSISVARDASGVATSVSKLVDSINDVLKSIDSQSTYDAASKTGGPFLGDGTIGSIRDRLLETVYPAGGGTLSTVGISVDREGLLTFDKDKFTAAYTADPAGVTAKFDDSANGFAERVRAMASGTSDARTGLLTGAINGQNTEITRLNSSITDWDDRLALRRSSLERQFTALETALNQMNSQSSWLSGQLASLNK